jgi:pseudouridine-5'-phosphate glycosidase
MHAAEPAGRHEAESGRAAGGERPADRRRADHALHERGREVARAHWELGGGGLVVGRPPDESLDDVEPLIEEALSEAERRKVTGQAVTPFVLSFLHEQSGGRTLKANRELILANATLAAEAATAP